MNTELSVIVGKIADFSEKTASKISEQDLRDVRALIVGYVDQLVDKIGWEEGRKILIESQNNILHIAAKFGDAAQLARVLDFISVNIAKEGGDIKQYVNLRDGNFFTPLHYSAKNGWTDAASALIEKGSDVSSKSAPKDREWMPIHYAAKGGYLEVVKVLIASGVSKEVKTLFGLTPLVVAAEYGHLELLQYLLGLGANKDIKTVEENHCMNALHYAAVGGFTDITLVLINAGMNAEMRTTSGLTALHYAVSAGNLGIIEILLKRGISKDLMRDAEHDLLCLAVFKGQKEVTSTFLKWGIGDLDKAYNIAKKISSRGEIAKELELYRKSIKNLFALKNLPDDFEVVAKSFNKENAAEDRIVLKDGARLNAHGIVNLRHKVGIFGKEKIGLVQLIQDKGRDDLSDSLVLLEKATVTK